MMSRRYSILKPLLKDVSIPGEGVVDIGCSNAHYVYKLQARMGLNPSYPKCNCFIFNGRRR